MTLEKQLQQQISLKPYQVFYKYILAERTQLRFFKLSDEDLILSVSVYPHVNVLFIGYVSVRFF